MAQLAPVSPLEEAVEDLKRWERKVRDAQDWLETATKKMQWEGRGADAFRATAAQRRQQLETAAGHLKTARVALDEAAEDVRRQRRRVTEAEQAYAHLKAQGALPAHLVGRTPLPHGDADWPAFLDGTLVVHGALPTLSTLPGRGVVGAGA